VDRIGLEVAKGVERAVIALCGIDGALEAQEGGLAPVEADGQVRRYQPSAGAGWAEATR
jgi:hypothetical protein